jgi:hypothetical protein
VLELGKDPDAFIEKHGEADGDGSRASKARKARTSRASGGGINLEVSKKTESKEWTVTTENAASMKDRIAKVIDAWHAVNVAAGDGVCVDNWNMRVIIDFGDAEVKNAVLDTMV